MVNAENDHRDVVDALRRAQPSDLPEGLQQRLTDALADDRRPGAPWVAFEEHADEVYTYLVALLDDADHAEELVVETFARVGKKSEPTFAELVQTARHAALEALAKAPGEASALSASDWALVSERRMGLCDDELTRIWSQLPTRLHERLTACGAALLAELEAHEGANTCAERERLPLALLDLLDAPSAEAYAQHLETCSACAEWTTLLEETMTPTPRTLPDGQRIREDVKKRLEPVAEQDIADLDIQVAVSCCYCHDRLGRKAAAFCATCLAPHHPDCFDEHGGCATPGCHGVQVVYPSDRGAERPQERKQRGWIVPGLIAALVGGGVAAFSSVGTTTRSEAWIEPAKRSIQSGRAGEISLTPVREDQPKLINLIEDTRLLELPAGEYTVPYLLEGWAKAHGLTPSVGALAKEVKIVLDSPQTLDREQLRTLLATQDLVLVVGPGKTARLLHQRNVGLKIGSPTLVEGDTAVDPDSYVSRVLVLRNPEIGGTVFATVRGILTRDANRIGNILYTQDPATLTIIDLARNVRYYEQMVAKLDQPTTLLPRARIDLFHVSAETWSRLRAKEGADALAGLSAAASELLSGETELLQSVDVDFAAKSWDGHKAPVSQGTVRVEAGANDRTEALTLEAQRSPNSPGSVSVILRSQDTGEVGCVVPGPNQSRVQAVLLSDGSYLVLVVSGK